MSGMIPENFINQLLAVADIVDVIKSYIPLKKTGHNYMACCPFHHEKTPSFSVVADKQYFNCFGCGAGGSVIKFVMTIDNLSFVEAVEKLAQDYNLEIPRNKKNKQNNQYSDSLDIIYRLNNQAKDFYKNQLAKSAAARQYLLNRGLVDEILTEYLIGYAPNAWHDLENYLKKLNNQPDLANNLSKSGLWLRHRNAGYDRFRDRIIFPLRNIKGQVIAFGARILNTADIEQPKYLNSPETIIFHKQQELYGLYELLQIKNFWENIIIVEGYMDVLSLSQSGIKNIVATLGTASSTKHLLKLFKYTNEVIFCFDGDSAGLKAAWQALNNSLPVIGRGKTVKFIFLPKNLDPDDYLKQYGRHKYIELITKAYSLAEFLFSFIKKDLQLKNINTVDDKVNFINKCKPLLIKITDNIYYEVLITKLAEIINLNISSVRKVINNSNTVKNIKADNNYKVNNNLLKNNLFYQAASILAQYPNILAPEYLKKFNLIKLEYNNLTDKYQFILYKLINIIKNNDNISIPGLLDNWDNLETKQDLIQLLAVNHLISVDKLAVELKAILNKLIFNKSSANNLNKLLRKISATGMASLTVAEKDNLKELLKK